MRATAVIDTSAFAHNLARVRTLAPRQRVYAAVKADGYGHGAIRVAQALSTADGFAVARIDEGLQLRWAGIRQPILVLSQMLDANLVAQAAANELTLALFHADQLNAVRAHRGPALRVWGMVDSGMHRVGFAPERVARVAATLDEQPVVECQGWMTHLACADDPTSDMTLRQIRTFEQATAGLPGARSIANSAGVIAWPAAHADVVRPGIMLYGSSPMFDRTAADIGLQPVMHLSAPLISRNTIAAGEPIGYGATWAAPQDMDVGIVAIGYGDGYPRHAPSGTPVLVGAQRTMLVGRVSMDMLAIDLRPLPQARVGDRVTFWGPGLPADEVATAAGTIAYELFCQLTPRVVFEYC